MISASSVRPIIFVRGGKSFKSVEIKKEVPLVGISGKKCYLCAINKREDTYARKFSNIFGILLAKSYLLSLSPETINIEIMSIDTYKLTSTEEPTDEVLSQLMREAAEEAAQKRAEATAQFFSKLKSDAQKIEVTW